MLGLCAVAGVIVSYYWRVFYGLDARGVPPLQITGLCVVLAMAAGAAALLLRHCKDFAKRGACCILLCGALFAFANPPLQTPDETDHYLRTYAISMGRFDFDAKRSYPEDVNELMDAFPGRVGQCPTPQRAWALTLTRTPSSPTTPQVTP